MKSFGVLLFSLIISSPTFASDSENDIPFEFIDGKTNVIKDFCRTEKPGLYNDCGFNQHQSMVAIYLPKSLGDIVLQHINVAKKASYYDELSHTDFFHGHFLFANSISYDSADEFFSDITAILYHTAEYNGRWGQEEKLGIPPLERRQRSLLGFLDGNVAKAVDWVTPPFRRGYIGSGTIYDTDIGMTHPELSGSNGQGKAAGPTAVKVCKSGECRVCEPFGQFNIIKTETGRFTTAEGEKIELYLRCFPVKN
jgi:hypothetical protein